MSNQKIVTETALSALASDIKTALSGKANSNDVYPKSQTYNRTEIDNALDLKADKSELYNVYPTDQESGSIAHIEDGADNIPVKSLVSEIVAVETGSGEKSPDNPYSISGHTEANVVVRASKNFFDKTTVTNGYRIGADGNPFPQEGYSISDWIETVPNIPIVANVTFSAYDGLAFYDSSKTFIERITRGTTVRVPTNAKYIRVAVNNSYLNTYQLQYGTTSTTYEAYSDKINTYTFAFGQTVYGGNFDNNGNLVVTHKEINLSALSWSATTLGSQNVWRTSLPNDCKGYADNFVPTNIWCEQYEPNSVDSMYSGYSGISLRTSGSYIYCSRTDLNEPQGKLIAELANPITLAITSQNIPTLSGENNIFSNCGDVEVDYHADIGLYIDKKISSLAQG